MSQPCLHFYRPLKTLRLIQHDHLISPLEDTPHGAHTISITRLQATCATPTPNYRTCLPEFKETSCELSGSETTTCLEGEPWVREHVGSQWSPADTIVGQNWISWRCQATKEAERKPQAECPHREPVSLRRVLSSSLISRRCIYVCVLEPKVSPCSRLNHRTC